MLMVCARSFFDLNFNIFLIIVFDRFIHCFVDDVIGDLFIDTFKLEHDVYEITKILGTRTVEVKVGWVFLLFALVNSVALADSVASAPAPEYVV